MVFLTLRAMWLRRQREKEIKKNKALKPVVRTLSPKSLIRYASTSRNAYESTALERKRIAALKRVLRRRVARERHFDTPPFYGAHRMLRPELQQARNNAAARAGMTPEQRRRNIQRMRVRAAHDAFWQAMSTDNRASWNRFVRLHVKAGGNPAVTRHNAISRYN